MDERQVFLSYSRRDAELAGQVRARLEDHGVAVWQDVLGLSAGEKLATLERRVREARALVVLCTPAALESEWVEREVAWALAAREADPGYRILPLCRDGVGERQVKRLLGGEELVRIDGSDLTEAVGGVLRALGELGPAVPARGPVAVPRPLYELEIELRSAEIVPVDGEPRAEAEARIVCTPAGGTSAERAVGRFRSPLVERESKELRWYLEHYPQWPFGVLRDRAKELEAALVGWGRRLHDGTTARAEGLYERWRDAGRVERRLVVRVVEGGDAEAEAALLALPWELFADDEGFLFEGSTSARVVRRGVRRDVKAELPSQDTLRVLLVIARPEQEDTTFFDPRASARGLVQALEPLGDRAELTVLPDGTFGALRKALDAAEQVGRPYQVVHFDGHGVYDPQRGLGLLCFEDAADVKDGKAVRRVHRVDAKELGALLRGRRIPLCVLEACQSAQSDAKVEASVAARVLKAGVASVVAMSHSVLVETARRFTRHFYGELARGARIGEAMVRAQQELHDDPVRGCVGSQGELRLQDWFVPVLFQEPAGDTALIPPGAAVDEEQVRRRRAIKQGELPQEPSHGFVGRARELLALERLLFSGNPPRRLVVVRGAGGQGKTALAVEAARWLSDIRRVARLAFVCVEGMRSDAWVLLNRLGGQLVRGWRTAVPGSTELAKAGQPLELALRQRSSLLVIDNFESVLAEAEDEELAGLVELLTALADVGQTRVVLTSREAVPAELRARELRIGRLTLDEGRRLVAAVLGDPPGEETRELADALIEQVSGHARSLVLLAKVAAERGLEVTRERVAQLMAELEEQSPGERELSLLASVRLSLDRLPSKAREQVRALAVFHGVAHVDTLADVLLVDREEAMDLCRRLVAGGMAESDGPYLLPDPALGPALASELSPEEWAAAAERWLGTTLGLIHFLARQRSQNIDVAAHGARVALPELLAAVAQAERWIAASALRAEDALLAATGLEQLVASMSRPAILARVTATRRRLLAQLEGWSHAAFEAAQREVERRLDASDLLGAIRSARLLLARAEAQGEDAYPEAAYDLAIAHAQLGAVLSSASRPIEALPELEQAQAAFEVLARTSASAAKAAVVAMSHRADALVRLRRFGDAITTYEDCIARSEDLGDRRQAAAARANLGIAWMLQGRHADALKAWHETRRAFENLHEPAEVALAWHQIGVILQKTGDLDAAENAFLRSLALNVERGDKARQAITLNELGKLYSVVGRPEEAAILLEQAVGIAKELGDSKGEATRLSNLASTLRQLDRLDEARDAARRASQLDATTRTAAEPWKTQHILHDIERDAGNPEAAAAARAEAVRLYLAYREQGGHPQFAGGRLATKVNQALTQDGPEAARELVPPAERFHDDLLPFRDALLAIIDGSRDPAVADDPRLHYEVAAELTLLLRTLST